MDVFSHYCILVYNYFIIEIIESMNETLSNYQKNLKRRTYYTLYINIFNRDVLHQHSRIRAA